MRLVVGVAMLVLLVSCQAPIGEESSEEVITFEKYELQEPSHESNESRKSQDSNTTDQNVTVPITGAAVAQANVPGPKIISVNQSLKGPQYLTLEQVEELSIAKQHKRLPLLENVTENSACAEYSFTGFEENSDLPVDVKRQLRFEYVSGLTFRGWILFELLLDGEQVAAETAKVLVENETVECLDEGNFSVDWDKIRRRFELTHSLR